MSLLARTVKNPRNYLIRLNSMHQADALAGNREESNTASVIDALRKKRAVNVGQSTMFLDTSKRASQNKTPYKLSGAIVYCAEVSDAEEVSAHYRE